MGNINGQVLSHLLTNDANARSMNAVLPVPMPSNIQSSSLPRLAQLQRDNEDLRRRIMEIENAQSRQGGGNQQHPTVQIPPDQFSGLSSIAGSGSNAASAGSSNEALERELERMQRDFRMRSNTPLNNSMNNSLLSSLGGGVANGGGSAPAAAAAGSNAREFSFMTGFPREEMLLRAMRLENQMGYLQQHPPGSHTSPTTPTLGCALQQHQNHNSALNMPPVPSAAPAMHNDEDRRNAMMDWVSKQQQQQHGL